MNVNVFSIFHYIFRKILFCEIHNKYYGYEKMLINKIYCEVLENESHYHE
jgi:hypothetical protein